MSNINSENILSALCSCIAANMDTLQNMGAKTMIEAIIDVILSLKSSSQVYSPKINR